MSEYMEKHSVARLIGAPPGYVGYEEGGALTEAVRRRPYQVVLFDEIEKAHPDVFNVLLQVLDDGRLTDGQGRTVDFRNTLIIMTSNLGAEYPGQPAARARTSDAVRDEVMGVVRAHFRPEFLNRVDEIILFHRLKRAQMGAIVDIQLARLQKLLDERKITLELDDGGARLARRQGLRPGLRRAAAEARDPEARAGSARRDDPRRRDPGRRDGRDHRRQGRADVQRVAAKARRGKAAKGLPRPSKWGAVWRVRTTQHPGPPPLHKGDGSASNQNVAAIASEKWRPARRSCGARTACLARRSVVSSAREARAKCPRAKCRGNKRCNACWSYCSPQLCPAA